MTRGTFALSAVFTLGALGALGAAEGLKSGLQVGDTAPAYNVRDITGPNAGKSLCYR